MSQKVASGSDQHMKQCLKRYLPSPLLNIARSVVGHVRTDYDKMCSALFEHIDTAVCDPICRSKLRKLLSQHGFPRIALVKQDVNEDLYCCPLNSVPADIVASTLLRSGPVALFTKFNADFYIVETEPDPECNVWKEKWTDCHWCPIEWFEAFKTKVPGRPHGQSVYALKAGQVEWGNYDIVISVDVSIPARITQRYPSVVWCYYIREMQTSSYGGSKRVPVSGQDLFLNHRFRLVRRNPCLTSHEVEFPYHFQYYGCFHELFGELLKEDNRAGVFIEHHTVEHLADGQLERLHSFGPVASTALGSKTGTTDLQVAFVRTTMESEFRRSLMTSKYFIKCGGRNVLGTAMVEAIAAGCLAIGDPRAHGEQCFFTRHTSASSFEQVMEKIAALERDPTLYRREVDRQRRLIDYLCYVRPALSLLVKANRVLAGRCQR